MSSTNRSGKRLLHASDYYVTPMPPIRDFLKAMVELGLGFLSGRILDPCAGGDPGHQMSYPLVLIEQGVDPDDLSTIDIRQDSRAGLKQDYLECTALPSPHLIITNPPFMLAQEIILKAFQDVEPGGWVAMLLRLNFLGGQKRFVFWRRHPAKYIFVHHKRMSFTDDRKTDSIEYAHFVWNQQSSEEPTKLWIL